MNGQKIVNGLLDEVQGGFSRGMRIEDNLLQEWKSQAGLI